MKLTAQEEYGLRCILCLARAESNEAESSPDSTAPSFESDDSTPTTSLTINDIAEIEGISTQYAGKLIRLLGKSGLVQSVRGCKGGYRLSRPPQKINVSEVLAALGTKIYDKKVCERFSGDRNNCVHTSDCSVRTLWSGIQMIVDHLLTQTTLAELILPEKDMSRWLETYLQKAEHLPNIQLENFTTQPRFENSLSLNNQE